MKLISILIPTFNREKYIAETLRTVIRQTYTNFEIIIYDDGSTDDTISIIKEWQQEYSCIRLIEGSVNKGVGYARNKLLDACQTPYACWQDSDDLVHYDRLKLQIRAMRKPMLIFTKWVWLHYHQLKWKTRLKNTESLAFATLMFPVDKTIRFREDIKLGGEDWDWVARMREKYEECLLPDRLYHVRFHSDRIGHWKKKLRRDIPRDLLGKLSYAEMIQYYKDNIK